MARLHTPTQGTKLSLVFLKAAGLPGTHSRRGARFNDQGATLELADRARRPQPSLGRLTLQTGGFGIQRQPRQARCLRSASSGRAVQNGGFCLVQFR
jgi:hypothetical protein